jgi:hypothetical protein
MSRGAADSVNIQAHSTAPREFIALGIPSFGLVHIFWVGRHYNLRFPMNKIVRQFFVLGREVGYARNEIVERALKAEQDTGMVCSHVFFLDDDVLAHPDALCRLYQRDRDIVSGLYFAKRSVPTPLVLMEDGIAKSWHTGEVVDCAGHGMGLTLIKMDVFRRMRDELNLPKDEYGHTAWFRTTKDEAMFATDGQRAYLSETEDMHFLRLARQLGYQPAVDTSAEAFAFHWAQTEQRGYPLKQWFEYAKDGRITWETDGPPVVWSGLE